MKMKKLIEAIPDLITDGIFSNISSPMWAEDFSADFLDLHFASLYSQRWISPLVEILLDDDNEISSANLTKLANSIYQIRENEWAKLYNDLKVTYSPIENTDAYETVTETRSGSGTDGIQEH